MSDEEKIIDQIIEILSLMSDYTPTSPSNGLLPLIRIKISAARATRARTNKKFKLNFINNAELTKQISSIKI